MEKELMSKVMNEEELDAVAGGAGFVYIRKLKDGNYQVLSVDRSLKKNQALAIMRGENPTKYGFRDGSPLGILPSVPPASWHK